MTGLTLVQKRFEGFLFRRIEILLTLGLPFFRASSIYTITEGVHCVLMWHRIFEALLAGRPPQGL